MPWIAANRRKDGAVSASADDKSCCPTNATSADFERAEHVIARWDQQLLKITASRENWVRKLGVQNDYITAK